MGITKTIEKEILKLGESAAGWEKMLTLTSWNGGKAKYDIREWSPDRTRCGKGITLTEAEYEQLTKFIKEN